MHLTFSLYDLALFYPNSSTFSSQFVSFVVAHTLISKPQSHIDNDSKKARSMENAQTLGLYTTTAQCIVADSLTTLNNTL
jgi:hypothetical protein